MSTWARIANVFRRDRAAEEIDEELRLHVEDAIEAGRDPEEARRAFGSTARLADASRDIQFARWLDAFRADLVFGWRMLTKHRTHTAASVLSLALTIGACVAAFRLIDAVLLRPLPVASPERLFYLTYEFTDQNGNRESGDVFEYPTFRKLRAAVRGEAELMAVTPADRSSLTFGSEQEHERVRRQYVSGWMFDVFGLRPALGRLFTEADDVRPGAHPYAVLSHDYWTRRFGSDPAVLGRTYRMGANTYEVVGVAPRGFTGTEPGSMTDLFHPTMMNAQGITQVDWGWFRTWVQVAPGVHPDVVRAKLAAVFANDRHERTKLWGDIPADRRDAYVNAPLRLEPATAGVSELRRTYARALAVLGALVALLLLIACVNVANLMLARAAARGREMALRVSIGAGRWRLLRMVLLECAMLAFAATALGGVIAWWSAPFVASMIHPPDDPVRLHLPFDWRVLSFAAAITTSVVLLFGLAPALRASAVKPMAALRGGADPRGRRRWMNALVAAQVAFCLFVSLLAGLFVATFDRVRSEPIGFAADRLLAVELVARGGRPAVVWEQVERHIRDQPGVESAALCRWPLMSSTTWIMPMRTAANPGWSALPPYQYTAPPGWFATMRISLLSGREFRPEETGPHVAIVNEAFAKQYFDGLDPVGRTFERAINGQPPATVTIVGWARDAKYRNIREAVRPTAYVPFRELPQKDQPLNKDWATIMVRTTSPDPMAMAAELRRQVASAAPGFRVASIKTQREIVDSHTVRERLLAALSLFFACVAIALAGAGLYGVLSHAVEQRRREIGVRMALGARAGAVAASVTAEVVGMLACGAAAGLALGVFAERFLGSLLYEVRATDASMLAAPVAAIALAGMLAALPPVRRAVRVDPAGVLRAE